MIRSELYLIKIPREKKGSKPKFIDEQQLDLYFIHSHSDSAVLTCRVVKKDMFVYIVWEFV